MNSIPVTFHGWIPDSDSRGKPSRKMKRKESLRSCLDARQLGERLFQSSDSRKTHCRCGKGTIISTESAPESEAEPERMVPMTKDQKKIKSLQEEITIYKTYFRVCAESETDPQKKRLYERLANAEDLESLSDDVLKYSD